MLTDFYYVHWEPTSHSNNTFELMGPHHTTREEENLSNKSKNRSIQIADCQSRKKGEAVIFPSFFRAFILLDYPFTKQEAMHSMQQYKSSTRGSIVGKSAQQSK